jgi:hypothetical protein
MENGASLAAARVAPGARGGRATQIELGAAGAVALELRLGGDGFRQRGDRRRHWLGEGVDHPLPFTASGHETTRAEDGEVFRDFHLGCAEHLLEMAHAKRPVGQQRQQSKPGRIGESLVKTSEAHENTCD